MSEEKINLEKIIKEELYNKHLYFNKTNTVQIKNICLEFGKQLLELAAENALEVDYIERSMDKELSKIKSFILVT